MSEGSMGHVLAFAEQRDGVVRGATHEVVSTAAALAASLDGEAHAIVVGAGDLGGAGPALGASGAERVKVASHADLGSYAAEAYASVVADAVRAGGYAAV
ncbi:MAG: hypothetical protein HKO98_14085, partial [Gemmatimonadetes bacterium]|nr:hypothetical protein [Gemmatimonadota bacterium]